MRTINDDRIVRWPCSAGMGSAGHGRMEDEGQAWLGYHTKTTTYDGPARISWDQPGTAVSYDGPARHCGFTGSSPLTSEGRMTRCDIISAPLFQSEATIRRYDHAVFEGLVLREWDSLNCHSGLPIVTTHASLVPAVRFLSWRE